MQDALRMIHEAEAVTGIHHKVIWCTPQIAVELLKLNTHNRKVRNETIIRYTREINNDAWVVTSQGIGIDVNGVLVDGQHRLISIRESGATVAILVVWGLPTKAQAKTDRGWIRSIVNQFSIQGIESRSTIIHAATYLARRKFRVRTVVDSDVESEFAMHCESLRTVAQMIPSNSRGLVSAGIVAALAVGYEMLPSETEIFINKIVTPTELQQNDPRFRFSQWARARASIGGLTGQDDDYSRTAYCMNAFFAGEQITCIRKASEVKLPDPALPMAA